MADEVPEVDIPAVASELIWLGRAWTWLSTIGAVATLAVWGLEKYQYGRFLECARYGISCTDDPRTLFSLWQFSAPVAIGILIQGRTIGRLVTLYAASHQKA